MLLLKKTIFLLISIFLASTTQAGDNISKEKIMQCLTTAADYAANVLMDENGKSRCDYHIMEGEWKDYEPPWHTGQLIWGLCRAYEATGNQKYLDAAKKAGDWWVGLEIKDHPRLKGMVRSVHKDGLEYIVFATMTDGSPGLFKLYDLTGIEKYAEVPTRAGDWMYANMYEPESRMFYDCVDPVTGNVMKEWSPFWPDKKEQTLNDVARPNNEGFLFKDMYDYTKNEKYKKIFTELCESLVEKQGPEGLWMDFVPNDKQEGSFHPRFNIWYAESLVEGYELTGDKRFYDAALKTARFYTKYQLDDGAFYYKNFLDGSGDRYSVSGSTTAFAGILWLRLKKLGAGDEFDANIKKSVQWILDNQFPLTHPDPNLAGGIMEIRNRSKKGKIIIYNRDIATSFSLRFLVDYLEYNFPK